MKQTMKIIGTFAALSFAGFVTYSAGYLNGRDNQVFDYRLHVAEKRLDSLVVVNSCIVQKNEAYHIQIRSNNRTYTMYDFNKDGTIDMCDSLNRDTAQKMYKKYVPELFDTSGLAAKEFEKW